MIFGRCRNIGKKSRTTWNKTSNYHNFVFVDCQEKHPVLNIFLPKNFSPKTLGSIIDLSRGSNFFPAKLLAKSLPSVSQLTVFSLQKDLQLSKCELLSLHGNSE